MDTLFAILAVVVLGLAVAQFFVMWGAFKSRRKGVAGGGGEAGAVVVDGAVTPKSRNGDGNVSESSDSGADGGAEGGVGGGG